MRIRERLNNVLKKLKKAEKTTKIIAPAPYWVKAVVIGQYQDELEGAVTRAGWIKSPQGNIVFDGSRGVFLLLIDTATMKYEPLSFVWPEERQVKIEYRQCTAGPTGMWPVAKSILILEDGRVFVWPERFHLYEEFIQDYIRQATEFFKDEKWDSFERDYDKAEAAA